MCSSDLGSSALAIAVCGALARWAGASMDEELLLQTAMNVECQTIRVPTGVQGKVNRAAQLTRAYRIDGTPALSVLDAEGLPCSNLHLQMGDGWAPPEGLVGDAYPFRLKSGRPFLPFQVYSDEDCGTLWNLSGRRGARVGCLNSIALSTFALRCAFGAAVPPMFGINLVKPSGNTRGLQAGTQQGDPSASESIPVVPGTVLFLSEMADSKGSPQMIVPQMGGNLQALQQYVDAYSQGQMSRLGVAGDQVQRNTSNPTSAGALAISQSAKRMKAAMVAPMFRRCDLEAIRKIAALLRLEGIGEYPEDG